MLTRLRNARLINATAVNLGDWSLTRGNPGIWNLELEHRIEFIRFLKEIPSNFQQLATAGDKREQIKNHMMNFYLRMPKEHEVEVVVERITNLAAYLKHGRDGIDDKTGQSNFKRDNWPAIKRCEICGDEFNDLNDVSLDHVIPLSLGGAEKKENWQLTCKLCNQQKMEYWGVADISRIESFRCFNGKFMGLSFSQIVCQLTAKSNPTRYWVFERDGRRCSRPECEVTAHTGKLYIACQEQSQLPTVENLASFCIDCLPNRRSPYCS